MKQEEHVLVDPIRRQNAVVFLPIGKENCVKSAKEPQHKSRHVVKEKEI
tara:strand:+ start:126 stop:272 length:147 start_codon:yes stop_codon:yes gene_type:complete